jgi:hypothetical protein
MNEERGVRGGNGREKFWWARENKWEREEE